VLRHEKESGGAIGLTEVFLTVVGRLRSKHPILFARSSINEQEVAENLPVSVPVALTLDTGNGLFTPVVSSRATAEGAFSVASELMKLRKQAVRGEFEPQQLSGGAILVSLLAVPGIVMAVLLVHPEHRAALALTSIREIPHRPKGGEWDSTQIVTVGLAYDHRYVNGREAILFLSLELHMNDAANWIEPIHQSI
jgi:2-oxoglutarate dehydrogenase E2 component (dihydrolipoamide succinyltransferase)